jgi:hypothetical protein
MAVEGASVVARGFTGYRGSAKDRRGFGPPNLLEDATRYIGGPQATYRLGILLTANNGYP